MSPEQAKGEEVDQQTDIWSLGVVLFEMLAGHRPFRAEHEAALMYSIVHEEPQALSRFRPDVPASVASVVSKALLKDRASRYQTAQELLSELATATAPGVQLPRQEKSIAVLPFVDMSPQRDQEYFCDGIAEELINALGKLQHLRVASRTSTFSFKGKGPDIRTIGEKLKVTTVLEGSIRKAGNRLRITAQLVKVEDGYQLWSERYDRELDDVFAVQDEISKAIVDRLKIKLGLGEDELIVKRYTENLEAYQLYLKGRFYLNERTVDSLKKSLEYFDQAVQKDPNYALAYTGMADSYLLLGWYGGRVPSESFSHARTAVRKALDIDPSLAEAHASLAAIKEGYDWDFVGAEQEFQRAIELNPNYAMACHWYGVYLARMGKFDEARRQLHRALELDPYSPTININVGTAYYLAREYDEAIPHIRKALEIDPNFIPAHSSLGQVMLALGRYDEAIIELMCANVTGNDPWILANLVHAYALAENKQAAMLIYDELKEMSARRYVPAVCHAIACSSLGETDKAFEMMEQAYQERAGLWFLLLGDPVFDNLRADPRFTALIKKIGLEPRFARP
jgi:serine/threonine-protein kinase